MNENPSYHYYTCEVILFKIKLLIIALNLQSSDDENDDDEGDDDDDDDDDGESSTSELRSVPINACLPLGVSNSSNGKPSKYVRAKQSLTR
jgi:hypothetical protein